MAPYKNHCNGCVDNSPKQRERKRTIKEKVLVLALALVAEMMVMIAPKQSAFWPTTAFPSGFLLALAWLGD